MNKLIASMIASAFLLTGSAMAATTPMHATKHVQKTSSTKSSTTKKPAAKPTKKPAPKPTKKPMAKPTKKPGTK